NTTINKKYVSDIINANSRNGYMNKKSLEETIRRLGSLYRSYNMTARTQPVTSVKRSAFLYIPAISVHMLEVINNEPEVPPGAVKSYFMTPEIIPSLKDVEEVIEAEQWVDQ